MLKLGKWAIRSRQLRQAISCGVLPPIEPQAFESFATAKFSQAWVEAALKVVKDDPDAVRGAHYRDRVVPKGHSIDPVPA